MVFGDEWSMKKTSNGILSNIKPICSGISIKKRSSTVNFLSFFLPRGVFFTHKAKKPLLSPWRILSLSLHSCKASKLEYRVSKRPTLASECETRWELRISWKNTQGSNQKALKRLLRFLGRKNYFSVLVALFYSLERVLCSSLRILVLPKSLAKCVQSCALEGRIELIF